MNHADALFARLVLAFVAGEVDHCDERTRADVARALYRLDFSSSYALGMRVSNSVQEWDALLALVAFDPVPEATS